VFISVEGMRTDPEEWKAAQALQPEELPALTPEQKQVATQLKIAQEQYARSILAGQRTTEKLLKKTEWFARFFEELIHHKGSPAKIERVTLDTWAATFEVKIHGREYPLRIDEGLVDDLFEKGSVVAEQGLSRIADVAIGAGVV